MIDMVSILDDSKCFTYGAAGKNWFEEDILMPTDEELATYFL